MRKSERSSKSKKSPKVKAPAYFKVFFIDKNLITGAESSLRLERFYHPGKNSLAWFVTQADSNLLEVLEFCEPHRSWLINSDICSNGKIYMTTPIDTTFLVLHHLRKHCTTKAMELEAIHDEQDPSVKRLMAKFISNATLNCISDVKSVGDMTSYKYNSSKALAWLALKTKHLAECLKIAGIHCGSSAPSQKYMRSEKAAEEPLQDIDFLRMACEIIGGYLDLELHVEFSKYLKTDIEDKDTNGKRKSLTTLKASKSKKIKVDGECSGETNGATEKLKNGNLLDDSLDAGKDGIDQTCVSFSPEVPKPPPLKERILTAKEKKLAVGAKGTKSIASFFKK